MATNNAINKFSDTLSMPSTNTAGDTGIIYVNSNRFMHSYGTGNTFLGESAGNLTLTTGSAVNNTGLGGGCLSGLTTGAQNFAAGTLAGFDISSANNCTALGYNALTANQTGDSCTAVGTSCLEACNSFGNTAIGAGSLVALVSGTNNSAIGIAAGLNYNGSESDNIIINNPGVMGESGITRLGTEGAQTTCYLAGNVITTTPTASTTRTLTVENSDNTAAATSASTVQITVGGANVGDPTTKYIVTGANTFTMGIDNSDSDAFKLDASNGLGAGANTFRMTTAGERTMPLQPAFLGILESTVSNVTGNGAVFQLGTTTALTEIFDQGNDFTTAGVFTAPVSARYYLNGCASIIGTTIATTFTGFITTSNRSYSYIWTRAASSANAFVQSNAFADMDAADTAVFNILISGEAADTDDVSGVATSGNTRFSGFLVC